MIFHHDHHFDVIKKMIGCNWKQEKRCSAFVVCHIIRFFSDEIDKKIWKIEKTFFSIKLSRFSIIFLVCEWWWWFLIFLIFDCFQSTTTKFKSWWPILFVVYYHFIFIEQHLFQKKPQQTFIIHSNRIESDQIEKNKNERIVSMSNTKPHRQTIFKSSIIDIITFQQ